MRGSLDGGGSSLFKPYRYVRAAPSGRVLGPFGPKTVIDFVHFGPESGMVFKGTRKSMNVFIVSIPNE